MTGDPKTEPPTKSAPLTGTLKSWWELGLSIATTLVAVLTSLGLGRLGQTIALSVAAVALAVTVLLWRRRRNRKVVLNDRIQAYRHWRERVSDSAFRGLYAFGRGDVLPGVERRRTAVALATSVKSERFRFGVVSGDVGCGKTSFVNAVASLLEGSGFKVFVCEGLHGLQQAAPGSNADPDVAPVTSRLREVSAAKAGGDPFILIIDQFEEFLIRYVLPDERQQLGDFLHQPIPGAESRVICAVRSDYLLDMHDLAPALPEPLSTRSLFRLRNFSIEEAEEVILECAERDGVPISREFAALIAHDLSHGSSVRPAELQIVCSALAGNPSLESYKAASGSTAILSEYIKNALEISVDPQLARVALRAFCDFDALPPAKAKPQTQAEIAKSLALDLPAQRRLGRILESLEESRLITSLPQSNEVLGYALVHDYVVGSIASATGDLRTPNEAADQDLRGFIFQFRSDPKTRIPLRKIAPLKKLASPALLGSTEAVDLLRRSRRSHLLRAGQAALIVALATVIAWTLSISRPRWERTVIDQMDISGSYPSFVAPVAGRYVWRGVLVSGDLTRFRLWDARTGRILVRDSVSAFSLSPRNELLLMAPAFASVADIVDLAHGTYIRTPFRVGSRSAFLSEKLLIDDLSPDSFATSTLRVWSFPDWSMIGALADVEGWDGSGSIVRLLGRTNRLVFVATHNGIQAPFVWTVPGRSAMRQLRPLISSPGNSVDPGRIAIDEREERLAALEQRDGQWRRICLWNLQLERLVRCREFSAPGYYKEHALAVSFSDDGRYVYVTRKNADDPPLLRVYETNDLLPSANSPPPDVKLATSFPAPDSGFVAVWEDPAGSARYWRLSDHSSSTLPSFSLGTVRKMQVSTDGRFLLVTRKNGQIELWSLAQKRLIRRLAPARGVASFTGDRRTIAVYSMAGGNFTFYDSESGSLLASLSIGTPAAWTPHWSGAIVDPVFYRNVDCQRFQVWTADGLVISFQRGRDIPFLGFVPSRRTRNCR